MKLGGNYLIQAQQAKKRFLTYDQDALIRKFRLQSDENFIYVNFLCKLYRISRTTGDMAYREGDRWADGNSYGEVMTLLDLLCDSREDRFLTGRWKSMTAFGLMFHRSLTEEQRDAFADRIDDAPAAFSRACQALQGVPLSGADLGYGIELFEGLRIGLQFWHGDDEFSPRVRYLWDENALQYLRYETMHFAVGLLRQRIGEEMDTKEIPERG